MDKNRCQTISYYDELGRPVLKNKFKYLTHDKAVQACKTLNLKEGQVRKLITYKCNICFKYHIGRNSTVIDNKYINKIKKENKCIDKNKKIELKIIGKIKL